ncbi:MAG: hypothetical protein ACI9YL_001311, partial [Luteibaculaceae bacterium]
MKKHIYTFFLILGSITAFAQQKDTTTLQQDAIYNRPFILENSKTALGGYVEGNTNYWSEDGISDGFSQELRRFNLFTFAQIHPKIQFLAEIEFEHGTEEIAIETAQIDFKVNTGFNFRAGIVLPALGLVNTNHDSPNWEFVERPLSSTELIPTTLSEVGFGFFGRFFPNEKIIISYNAYVLNGLQDGIILNSTGRTSLASGKNPEFFGEDNNGSPALNGRISVAKRKRGEIGFSAYSGIYNTFMLEGEQVDHKRRVNITALDFNTTIGKLTLQGELVKVTVDVPEPIQEIYGTEQFGGFVDFIIPIKTAAMMGFNDAKINGS